MGAALLFRAPRLPLVDPEVPSVTDSANLARWTVRVSGLVLLVLGAAIWTGNADALIGVHMLVGVVLVLALWTLAAAAWRAGASPAIVLVAVAWGVLLPALGATQENLLEGDTHWIIQVVHLALGVVAIGLGEMLGAVTARSRRLGA